MNNKPKTILLINEKSKSRRIIYLFGISVKNLFKSASAKCKVWVLNNGFPFYLKVKYGESGKAFNDMVCNNSSDLDLGLQAFVKEYLEE